MSCEDLREAMVEVLYGEADTVGARRFEEHQAGCRDCRQEMAALRRLRKDLGAWTLPSQRESLRNGGGARAWWPLAAAAVLALALGAALRLPPSELRSQEGRLRELLGAQEARHQREMQALRAELARPASSAEEALLDTVRSMIRESEARQARLVGMRVSQLRDDNEAQRRHDLAQVGAGLSYLEGKTGLQMARTTELMGHVLQAAQKK